MNWTCRTTHTFIFDNKFICLGIINNNNNFIKFSINLMQTIALFGTLSFLYAYALAKYKFFISMNNNYLFYEKLEK